MNSVLKLKITLAGNEVVDFNGYKYNVCYTNIGGLENFKVLIPLYQDVEAGDCITTDDWVLANFREDDGIDLCIRLSSFEITQLDDDNLSRYLNTAITGRFLSSDKCYLRTVGPDAKPFYMASLKVKNATHIPYTVPIVAFGGQAKKLSTVKRESLLQCDVTVKKRRNNEGYEFAVIKFDVI